MYTPREGQWSWFLHRVSGVAIFLFLFGHIASTAIIVWGPHGPAMHEKLDAIYRLPIFTVLFHPLLFAAVVYHALNGIRICIIDWWARSTLAERPLFYAELVLLVALMVFSVFKMILPELNAAKIAALKSNEAQARLVGGSQSQPMGATQSRVMGGNR